MNAAVRRRGYTADLAWLPEQGYRRELLKAGKNDLGFLAWNHPCNYGK